MAYSISIYKSVRDFIQNQIPKHQRQIKQKIETLKHDPRPPRSKLLGGSHDLHRIRSGNFRIIYKVDNDKLVVVVVMVGGSQIHLQNTSETWPDRLISPLS